ncbi:MAG: HAD-IIB family hydrolase [Anaerolineae bacterium]|nr:HAD-IIB family hydrolase [Anaerolineae bacterium]
MNSPSRWLFVSDVDDTLLGDEVALRQLALKLQARPHLLTVYNSSRPCASLRQTLAQVVSLPFPNYLIGALGTEIQKGVTGEVIEPYGRMLKRACFSQGERLWDRELIVTFLNKLGLTAHPDEYQTPFKVSYDLPDPAILPQVFDYLATTSLEVKVIYSGGKNLDIIPRVSGKGSAVEYLRRRLGIPPERVVVAGDSGNDLEMFAASYKGIVVANASVELKQKQGERIYHAQAAHAAGVLEGLRFWQVVQN